MPEILTSWNFDDEEFWEQAGKRMARPCTACGMPLRENERIIHAECEDDE